MKLLSELLFSILLLWQSTISAAGLTDFTTRSPIDFNRLSQLSKPAIIDYGSEGCGPCRAMKPYLISFYEAQKDLVYIRYIDAWATPAAAANVPLRVIPTQIFFDKYGRPFNPSPALQERIRFQQYLDKVSGEIKFTIHEGGITRQELDMILSEMLNGKQAK